MGRGVDSKIILPPPLFGRGWEGEGQNIDENDSDHLANQQESRNVMT